MTETRIVSAEREIAAPFEEIFELIADPALQPQWDGNDNLTQAARGQRVHRVGDVFRMIVTGNRPRDNEVVEFTEGRLIAWKPSPVGEPQPGQLWRWELEPRGPRVTLVRHTYDWTELHDEQRLARARTTTPANLMASIERLKELAESQTQPG
ncbi:MULTISPECIES: SRPBCC family protein [unclassified Luteococcus]|uniref:SRPBCC family protein n=1 Tax=unclassified Luteococcus TaxID=2639923 RepID=UPI00313BD74E